MTAPTDFIEVPSGALCGASIVLTCKGPDEERSYVIEYDSQLDPDDYIAGPITWEAGDTALSVTNATPYGRRFRFTLNGGTLNQKSGVTFTIPLKSGDIRTLTCVLTIEEQGVLQTGTIPVIMGAQGQRGSTIFLYGESGDPPDTWQPDGYVLMTGDFVINLRGNYMKRVTVNNDGSRVWGVEIPFGGSGGSGGANADTLINTDDNSENLGWILDNAALSKKVTDFFFVNSSGGLSVYYEKLPLSPSGLSVGAVWNNGSFLTIVSN